MDSPNFNPWDLFAAPRPLQGVGGYRPPNLFSKVLPDPQQSSPWAALQTGTQAAQQQPQANQQHDPGLLSNLYNMAQGNAPGGLVGRLGSALNLWGTPAAPTAALPASPAAPVPALPAWASSVGVDPNTGGTIGPSVITGLLGKFSGWGPSPAGSDD